MMVYTVYGCKFEFARGCGCKVNRFSLSQLNYQGSECTMNWGTVATPSISNLTHLDWDSAMELSYVYKMKLVCAPVSSSWLYIYICSPNILFYFLYIYRNIKHSISGDVPVQNVWHSKLFDARRKVQSYKSGR